MSEPLTGIMEDEESISLSSATNKTQDSVENLVVRMKFSRETAMLTMPTWQSAAHEYSQSVLKIFDQIISVLTRSSDHLTIGSVSSDGNIQARLTPMVYFAGLLISNFHPGASEVNGTFERMDVLFISIENETIKLVKSLKKLEAGLGSFTKSLVDEFSHQIYKSFPDNGKNENDADLLYDRSMFQKYSLHNFPGVWLELINLERESLYLQCPDVKRNGHLIRIPAEDLQLEVAVKLGSLLLTEIQETIHKACTELAEIELTPEIFKEWKKASTKFTKNLKLIRKVHKFSSYNCAADLANALIEISWKMDVVIYSRIRVLNAVCVWILKGIECIRRKTSSWAPDHEVITTPQVKKRIKARRPNISKFLRCFKAKSEESLTDYAKMFADIGNVIGESFPLEVAISQTMKEILFEGCLEGRSEDASNESLTEHEVERAPESEERIIIDHEKIDIDIDGDSNVTADSKDVGLLDHTHVSEPISGKDSSIEMEMHAIFAHSSDSGEFLTADAAEKMTLTGTGFEDDGVSISSNPLHESVHENPGKSGSPRTASEENQEGDPSNSPVTPDGNKSSTTEEQSPRNRRFYWARRLMERMSKPK